MADNPHHQHLIKELQEQLAPLLTQSPQAIYVYLDDEHKFCNEKFAKLLGYKNPQEWVDNHYPVEDIAKEDQEKGIEAYMHASRNFTASALEATWLRKDGTKVKTQVIMTPFSYRDEVFVLHYITTV